MKRILGLISLLLVVSMLGACTKPSASNAAGSAAASVPTIDPATLTGLPKYDGYPVDRRLTAVMVNNIGKARPTSGLTDAEMLVEIKVEGGITRFMALYSDYEKIPNVGTFRSARDQFFQLILPFQALYAHVGESTMMNQYFQDFEYHDYNVDGNIWGDLWWYDQDRINSGLAREYTAYTDGDHIAQIIKEQNLDDKRTYNSTFFDFVPYDQDQRTLKGEEMDAITINHSSAGYRTMFDYDSGAGQYMMSMYNPDRGGALEETIDENNDEQIHFSNVLVLFAQMNPYPGDSGGVMQVHYEHGGFGYYFNGGRYELVRWMKPTPMHAIQIVDAEGNEVPVQLNPGKTYMAIVDDQELEGFHNSVQDATGGTDVSE